MNAEPDTKANDDFHNWNFTPGKRPWSPCRCCGSRGVVKTTALSFGKPGTVWIVVYCDFCETRRGGYYRKVKKGGAA
jgi:hypothetical protein